MQDNVAVKQTKFHVNNKQHVNTKQREQQATCEQQATFSLFFSIIYL